MDGMVFLSLLLAHVVGDFYFQNDRLCRNKAEKKIKSPFLYIHSLTIGLLSWALLPTAGFWLYAILIAVTHLFIDTVKSYLGTRLMSFIIDQFLHTCQCQFACCHSESEVGTQSEAVDAVAVAKSVGEACLGVGAFCAQYSIADTHSQDV